MSFNRVLNSILPSIIPKLAPNSLIALLIPRMLSGFHPFLYRSLVRATLNTRLNLSVFDFLAAVRFEMETCLYWVLECLGDREAELAG
jgi:hypothetical protein